MDDANNETLDDIAAELGDISETLSAIHAILERAFSEPEPLTYSEAGEHLERPVSDDAILSRDNHTCRRCGRTYRTRNENVNRNARWLHVAVVPALHGMFPPEIRGQRVTLCHTCYRLIEPTDLTKGG